MDERSNTTPKQPGGITGKGFVKGDPRINRKGRPKSFDALRALALEIAHEKAKGKDGERLVIEGHTVSIVEAILRQWAMGKDKKLQKDFVEIAFGKVPDKHEVTFGDSDIDAAIEAELARLAAVRKAENAGAVAGAGSGDDVAG